MTEPIRWTVAVFTSMLFVAAVYGGLTRSPGTSRVASFKSVPARETEVDPDVAAVTLVAELDAPGMALDAARIADRLHSVVRFLEDETSLAPEGRQTFTLSYALMALVAANRDGRYDRLVERARRRLAAVQWKRIPATGRLSPFQGGIGYHAETLPDLYHTSLAIEALHRAGVPASDPCLQRALGFVSRCQNLTRQGHDSPSADAIDDGGFSITPATGDASIQVPDDGPLHACGSLTCAGLKSLIFCGVPRTDERIQTAVAWLGRNYTLATNPGIGSPRSRLYDYYLSLATALTAVREDFILDARNVRHDWRAELARVLTAEQLPDGCWLNPAESPSAREADPLLTTSYAMMTLSRIARQRGAMSVGSRLVSREPIICRPHGEERLTDRRLILASQAP